MINYIIQVVLCQVLFLAVYDFFLQKETFFKLNRFYLITTPILSFIIPILKFDIFRESVPQEYIVLLPEVVLNPQSVIMSVENSSQSINYLNILFYSGVILFAIIFLIKLWKILKVILSNVIVKRENYKLVLLENKQSAFSFFNYIFIHKSFLEKEDLHILEHELVHTRQNHTVDLLFFEILRILMWFNPIIYIYQNRIKLLHEYISDDKVVKQTDRNSYFDRLLAETFNVENISFINQFYKHSFIKKRVIMITKEKSKRNNQLKYLLLIPVLLSMLFYVSFTVQAQETISDETIEIVESNDGEERNTVLENEIVQKTEDVPFTIIENVPVFPGCVGSEVELKKCLTLSIQKYVAQNFNLSLGKQLGLKGKQKIYVQFNITKTGDILIKGARAPHNDLAVEARRVINSLPKMSPGKQRGKDVNVTYMLPIAFEINE